MLQSSPFPNVMDPPTKLNYWFGVLFFISFILTFVNILLVCLANFFCLFVELFFPEILLFDQVDFGKVRSLLFMSFFSVMAFYLAFAHNVLFDLMCVVWSVMNSPRLFQISFRCLRMFYVVFFLFFFYDMTVHIKLGRLLSIFNLHPRPGSSIQFQS